MPPHVPCQSGKLHACSHAAEFLYLGDLHCDNPKHAIPTPIMICRVAADLLSQTIPLGSPHDLLVPLKHVARTRDVRRIIRMPAKHA